MSFYILDITCYQVSNNVLGVLVVQEKQHIESMESWFYVGDLQNFSQHVDVRKPPADVSGMAKECLHQCLFILQHLSLLGDKKRPVSFQGDD